MRMSTVCFFLCTPYEDGAAYDDRLHLSAWLCDPGVSRYAHGVARAPSPPPLLADLHASRLSRAQDLGRAGQMDARHHHRLALGSPAQSRLLERASHRQLVGAGPLDDLARTDERDPASVWRREPC